ncbi:hypothetical protein F-LCD7_0099 [Faustovirus]|nr:hypothetical protein F-LCD7_0099 [Faustovirus]
MDACILPVEIFSMIAAADSGNALALRLTSRALKAAIDLPLMRAISSQDEAKRHIIYTQHGIYKLRQLYVNDALVNLQFHNGTTTVTIDCMEMMPMGCSNIIGSCTAVGKAAGDAVITTRSNPKIYIPRGNRSRRSINNGNIITYYYTSRRESGATITARSLVHIKSISNGSQTYKIWMNDHYLVLDYTANWKLKHAIYEESRITMTV